MFPALPGSEGSVGPMTYVRQGCSFAVVRRIAASNLANFWDVFKQGAEPWSAATL